MMSMFPELASQALCSLFLVFLAFHAACSTSPEVQHA